VTKAGNNFVFFSSSLGHSCSGNVINSIPCREGKSKAFVRLKNLVLVTVVDGKEKCRRKFVEG